MGKGVVWVLAVVLTAVLTVGLRQIAAPAGLSRPLGYGLGYALLGLVVLLALRQCRPAWHPAMHRMVALLSTAALALAEVAVSGLAGDTAQQAFFSALLGVAVVQLLARLLDRKDTPAPPGGP